MSFRQLLLAGIAAAAIGLLSVLFVLSRSSDPGGHARIVDLMGEIRESEEMLGRVLLQISTRRLLTYDPALAAERSLERALAALRQEPAMQAEPEAGLLERYAAIVATRRLVVEHFKSADAIYRNSSLYVPLITNDFSNRMRAAGHQDVAAAIADWDQTLFLRLHGRVSESVLDAATQQLRALGVIRPEIAPDIELLAMHAVMLVSARAAAAAFLDRGLELSRGEVLSEIYRVYMKRHVAEDRRAGGVLYALYGAAFLCVLSLVMMVVKLDRLSGQLAGTNRTLREQAGELELRAIEMRIGLMHHDEVKTLLEATLEHMSQGIQLVDGEGRIRVWNRRMIEMLDLPAELMATYPRLVDIAAYQIARGEYGPEDSKMQDRARQLLASDSAWREQDLYERRRPDGTVLDIRSTPLPGGGAVRTYTDVTEARAREAALRDALGKRDAAEAALRQHRDDLEREVAERTAALAASEARLRLAIETIPEGFVLFDADDRLVLCNAAYRDIYGFTEDVAAPGVTFEALVRDTIQRGLFAARDDIDEPLRERVALHQAVTSADRRSEQHLNDGRWIEFHERRTGDGGIVGLRIDVTETRQREAVAAERNKLAALGQLAGGVAHEINNLLQPSLTFPELVRDRLPPEDLESREDLEVVMESARKARDIVRSILLFSRKELPTLETVDLALEAGIALKFVRDLLPPGIALQQHIEFDGAMAAVNKTQLTQVLTNLVMNAAHASGGNGTIAVTVGRARPPAEETEALGIAADSDYLTLAVADSGSGMDEATQARIFEPFFTTKPMGEGTGLGLSVVFGILRGWGGAIVVDSALGRGTVFTLYVPMAGPPAPTDGTAQIAA